MESEHDKMSDVRRVTMMVGRRHSGKTRECLRLLASDPTAKRLSLECGVGTHGALSLQGLLHAARSEVHGGPKGNHHNIIVDDQNHSQLARAEFARAVQRPSQSQHCPPYVVVTECVYCVLDGAGDGAEVWAMSWECAALESSCSGEPVPRSEAVQVPSTEDGFDLYRSVVSPLQWPFPAPPTKCALVVEWGTWADSPTILSVMKTFWQQALSCAVSVAVVVMPATSTQQSREDQVACVRQLCLHLPVHFVAAQATVGSTLTMGTVAYLQGRLGVDLDRTYCIYSKPHQGKWERLAKTVGLWVVDANLVAQSVLAGDDPTVAMHRPETSFCEATPAGGGGGAGGPLEIETVLRRLGNDYTDSRPDFLSRARWTLTPQQLVQQQQEQQTTSPRSRGVPAAVAPPHHHGGGMYMHVAVEPLMHKVLARFLPAMLQFGAEYIHHGMVIPDSFRTTYTRDTISSQMRCYNSTRTCTYDVGVELVPATGAMNATSCACDTAVVPDPTIVVPLTPEGAPTPSPGPARVCRHVAALVLLLLRVENLPVSAAPHSPVATTGAKPPTSDETEQTVDDSKVAAKPAPKLHITYVLPSSAATHSGETPDGVVKREQDNSDNDDDEDVQIQGNNDALPEPLARKAASAPIPEYLLPKPRKAPKKKKGGDDDEDDDGQQDRRGAAVHDPNAPKRPLSAYFHFCSTRRAALREANPTCRITEIAKLLAAEWRTLGEAERVEFSELAAKDKLRYQREMESYQPPPRVPVAPRVAKKSKGKNIKRERHDEDDMDDDDEPVAPPSLRGAGSQEYVGAFERKDDDWRWDEAQNKWLNRWDEDSLQAPADDEQQQHRLTTAVTSAGPTPKSTSSGNNSKKSKKATKAQLATLAPPMSMGTTFGGEGDDDLPL
eukprot:PhM_4_TR13080/c0_g1_i1/m.56708